MKNLNSLFNLNPNQFSLGRSSGTFAGIGRVNNNADAQQQFADMISSLSVPVMTAKKPDIPEGTLPTVNPIPDYILAGYNKLSAQLESNIGTFARIQSDIYGAPRSRADALKEISKGVGYWSDKRRMASGTPFESKYVDLLNASNSFDSIKAQLETQYKPYWDKHNADITAYNKAFAPYKVEAEAYNKAVGKYNTELEAYMKQRNAASDKFQAQRQQNAQVSQDQMLAEGDVLASSALYSDDLHKQMLQQVSAANAEPVADNVSSLFAKG